MNQMASTVFVFLMLGCSVSLCNEQLVGNGGFEFGNVGFETDYVFVNDGMGQPAPGSYGVTFNAAAWNDQFAGFGGHSPLGGTMLIVNSSTVAGAAVWRQTIEVDPNSTFLFSYCAVSAGAGANVDVLANGGVLVSNSLDGAVGNWQFFTTTWDSGQSNQLVLEIVNNNTAAAENDFAIDNVSLQQVVFGDLNGDCVVNLLDVQPFVDFLSTGQYSMEADINRDGVVNLLDVQPFIAILSGS